MTADVVEPQAIPDPATTRWVPVGPGSVGIPTPVVNGQWIKGAGGAAVWSPIADTDVPSLNSNQRLGPTGKLITDANTATANGWYYMNPGGSNAPPGSDYVGILTIEVNGPGNLRQIAVAYNVDTIWSRRFQDNTTWGLWKQNLRAITGIVNTNGSIAYGTGFTVAHTSGAGTYTVTLNNPLATIPVITVTPSNTSVVCAVQALSAQQFNVIMTTPSAYTESGFYFHVLDSS